MAKTNLVLASLSWDTVTPKFFSEWTILIYDCLHEQAHGWDIDLSVHFSWGSLLPSARNRVFLGIEKEAPNYTHILMIDSDVIGLKVNHIKRLLSHEKDIVAACVPMGHVPSNPACEAEDKYKMVEEELAKESPGIIERKWVGTGCVLVSRRTVEATRKVIEREDGLYGNSWFVCGRQLSSNWDRKLQRVLQGGVKEIVDIAGKDGTKPGDFAPILQHAWSEGFRAYHDGVPSGEDVDFGERARTLGIKSYLDCGIQLRHIVEREVEVNKKCFTKRLSNDNQSVSVCDDNLGDSTPGVLDGDAGPVGAGKESVTVDG
jgi:hypothetical protein